MAVDFGPLLVFFLAYKFGGGGIAAMMTATLAFMGAIVIAIGVGHFVLGRVSPMSWLSAILILVFGGLTVYFHDPRFIQIKPTIIYLALAALVLVAWARKRAMLKWLFGPIFPGLDETGWLKLSRNWGLFFLVLAVANEVARQALSFDAWLTLKVWGVSIASLLFAAANIPMLVRHGLDVDEKAAAVEKAPLE
ncbi:inner membrane-spanning protein YciB [Sphingomonas sp. ASV193]|uniref:inner membrane-spanning protein YciB n=1 Tax=Sphingomonas sp. ASV193 TaxID=3144405 RepID=UPI0032E930AA